MKRKNLRSRDASEDCKCCMIICSPCLALFICLENLLKELCLCSCKICCCDCEIKYTRNVLPMEQNNNSIVIHEDNNNIEETKDEVN